MAAETLLDIRNLRTHFQVRGFTAKAVDDVSLSIPAGQTLGLVGESGCGKSVTAHSIIRLIPEPPGKIVGGQVLFEGQDLLTLSEARMRRIRGKRISMIFQEPMTSLNPTFPVGDQVGRSCGCTTNSRARRPRSAWWTCSSWWAFRRRKSGCSTTPTR